MSELLLIIQHYGYFGIMLLLSLGIIGLPIPDEFLMTFVGYLVSKDFFSYPLAVLSSIIGALSGITISYILGLKLGLPFLKKVGPKIHISEEKIEKAQHYFRKYGVVMVFFGYFIPGVRHLTGYFAGIAKLPLRKFFLYSGAGATVWAFTFITLGNMLGYKWILVEHYVKKYALHALAGIILVAIILFVVYKRKQKKRK
ncbi:DedA family protein [Bacillus horti]|uniref:Membrane protein DedA with SNARE-associated domain n=1 Tax=Caldalkalibacillus horti TaxID=77523 RepID=A0ABT9W3A8_9BACI|nr:DedA family protein [Bacillus horti]MDQ0167739.1 membrane protein DedA with SNARE-associated domain [Bacillus horti]